MSFMKKLYIKPSIEVEAIEPSDMIASTIDVNANGFDAPEGAENDPNYGISQGGPGDGSDFAKESTFIWDDEF